jgi:hypothetical protein
MLGFGGYPFAFGFCGNKNHFAPKTMVGNLAIFSDLNKYVKLPFNIGR